MPSTTKPDLPKVVTRDDLPRRHPPGAWISSRQKAVNEAVERAAGMILKVLSNRDDNMNLEFSFAAADKNATVSDEAFRVTAPTAETARDACRRNMRKAMKEVFPDRDDYMFMFDFDLTHNPDGSVTVEKWWAYLMPKDSI